MKMLSLGWVAAAVLLTGCRTYQFQLVEPAAHAQVIAKEPVRVSLDPLEYQFARQRNQIEVRISNPTEDRIVLQGDRSFVVDPRGQSHPLISQVVAPRSFVAFVLPPTPRVAPTSVTYAPTFGSYPGWGIGWGTGYGYHSAYVADLYYVPIVNYARVMTPYDWDWRSGPARLQLSYERAGQTFDHDLEFSRQRVK